MNRPKKKIPLIHLLRQNWPEIPQEKLLALILCGEVEVEGGRIKDPKCLVNPDAVPRHLPPRFVSRGGWKLEGFLNSLSWSVEGKVILDAGSSTGGFTDCLLQRGAVLVHSVDVGRNQLHWKLRKDPRVKVQEGTGIMDVLDLDPPVCGAVADLSFRSLRGAAGHILHLTTEGWLIALIKPQFEWKNPTEDFKGIVPTGELKGILKEVLQDLEKEGIWAQKLAPSELPGSDGNQEFLALLTKTPGPDFESLFPSNFSF
ncbi:MAG: hypothetical protein A2Z96_02235 [Spirochaetes bacterium GWB1_48_6]|nr:MAG: hypothetical protein A2Z96_02235 [Spirochaetes bacterium GWB1_48_6]